MSKNKTNFENTVLARFPSIVKVWEYTTAKGKAVVSCIEGHKWQLIPTNLLSRGNGSICPVCSNNTQYKLVDGLATFTRAKTHSDFTDEIRSINPDVQVLGKYTGAHLPVELGCKCGYKWKIIPTNLLTRHNEAFCSKCVDKWAKYRTDIHTAAAKIQVKYPELELLEYSGRVKECVVKSSACGHQFTSWFSNLVQGKGYRCNTCIPVYGRSKNEMALEQYIRSIYSGWVEVNDRTIIKPKELDIVIPDLGLAIEYNSPYTHHDKDHLYKTSACEAMGFRLIQVNEDEWQTKQAIVKSRIASVLGSTYRLGARSCTLQKIGFPGQFLEDNHIQGAGAPSPINYGLFLQEELVAVMTFGKPRFNFNYDYELIRYCSLTGVTIAGGASRLLKAFRKEHPGVSILSYSDKRWSTGALYKTIGFEYSHTSVPSYAYYKNGTKLSRFQCQKHLLEEKFAEVYDSALTEGQIMELAGYNRMYDCGTDVWILKA